MLSSPLKALDGASYPTAILLQGGDDKGEARRRANMIEVFGRDYKVDLRPGLYITNSISLIAFRHLRK
jgi:hypothetical protein